MQKKSIVLLTSVLFLTASIALVLSPLIISSVERIEKAPHLAGSWYPVVVQNLEKAVASAATEAQQRYYAKVSPGTVRALISPHAGIAYSGAIAASVYALAQNSVKRIIILAPDHSESFEGIATSSFDQFAIPTGIISVDKKTVTKLLQHRFFKQNDEIFTKEHSLEMQLPFIHHFLEGVLIIPLIVGKVNCMQSHDLAKALKPYIDNQTLVAATSDFIHYGKQFGFAPFSSNQQNLIRSMDSQLVSLIEKGQCDPFTDYIEKSGATICGSNPIKILMSLIQMDAFGPVEPRLIAYDRSGKFDQDDSVSYVGMIFTTEKLETLPPINMLTQQEQRNLFKQAQDTLKNMFDPEYNPHLHLPIQSFGVIQPKGAFTTLRTQDDKLRGCIGRIITPEPLYKTIATVTADAAIKDSRFAPVTKKEAPFLKMNLSILSSPHPIDSYKNIVIGKHGIILKKDGKSAVFLPEVPGDFNWGLEQTLSQLAIKAGLAADVWKDPETIFEVFESLNIEE